MAHSTRSLFAETKSEIKHDDTVSLNYIWIGNPPTAQLGVPGHDVSRPKHMARHLKKHGRKNPILFWCLNDYEAHYISQFSDYADVIKVCSIEKKLDQFITTEDVIFLRQAMQETLFDPKRNQIRDKVTIKNIVSACIDLFLDDDCYVMDSNIWPRDDDEPVIFPRYTHFKIPSQTYKPRSAGQIDFWMMYFPRNSDEVRKLRLSLRQSWLGLQQMFEREGYSDDFHHQSARVMMVPLFSMATRRNFWVFAETPACTECFIVELHLAKGFYNTHRPENRFEFNSRDKNKVTFLQQLKHTPLQFFPPTIQDVIFDYAALGPGQEYGEIFYAIQQKNTRQLLDLIENKADINQQMQREDAFGETPVHFAIRCKSYACLELLLDVGANLDLTVKYPNRPPMTPYEFAVRQKDSISKGILGRYHKMNTASASRPMQLRSS